MNFLRFALLAGLILTLTACAGKRARTSGGARAPLGAISAYETWSWSTRRSLALVDPAPDTAQVRDWLERAIDAELGVKGFIKARPEKADLLVAYTAGNGGVSGAHLVVELVDRATGQAVYRGAAKSGTVAKALEKRSARRIQKVVGRALKGYRK